MREYSVIVLMVALALCLMPATAGADVIYNTFAATNPFSAGGGPSIVDTSFYQAIAYRFTISGGDYLLDSLEVGAMWKDGPKSLRVSLMDDNGGSVGNPLTSATVDFLSDTGDTWEILTATSTDRPLLKDGQHYWIAVEPGAYGTFANWCNNAANVVDKCSLKDAPEGSWSTPFDRPVGNFRVYGTTATAEVVPEPSALILALLGGSGAMGGRLLRRRR